MMDKVGMVTLFIAGLMLLVAIVMSLVYHQIAKKTAPYWELQRQLQELEHGGTHPSEQAEFEEEIERRQAQLADIEALSVWEDRLRRWGLIVMYAAVIAGSIAMVIGGYKAFG